MEDGQQVQRGQVLCRWDPHTTLVLAEVGGRVRFHEVVEGETLRKERDPGGSERWVIREHKGDLHPQVVIEDERGVVRATHYLPEKALLEVREGMTISPGTLLARAAREVFVRDLAGGMPRVTDLFEARSPWNPPTLARVAGVVRLGERKRGKRMIYITPVDENGKEAGVEVEHAVPPYKHLRVHTGERVNAGDRLTSGGPPAPREVLEVLGPEAVQHYLVEEVQSIYRAQRVEIDDKHIEVIVAQMLRKVKVEEPGDSGLLPGSLLDPFTFRAVNQRLPQCVKVQAPGESKFGPGQVVPREVFEKERARLEAEGKAPPTCGQPELATGSTPLLGVTAAAVPPGSFLAAAGSQDVTRVLTAAALAGRVDPLAGLKENVLLGRLIPAGTGFPAYRKAEVRETEP